MEKRNIDKTAGIKNELEKMRENGEIDEDNIEQVNQIIEYLTHNNIFKYEKRDTLDRLPTPIVNVLIEARDRYLLSKAKLSDATSKVKSNEQIDFEKIKGSFRKHATTEILSEGEEKDE